MNRLPSGHFYVQKLGKYSRVDDAKHIAKLKSDKTTLKRHLKVTRHNNGVLKTMLDELKNKNEEIEGHLQESKAKIEDLKTTDADLIVSQQETKECNDDLEAQKSKNLSNLKLTEELKANRTKLLSDLENFENTDANLVISQQETKECNEQLEVMTKKNLHCQSENISNLKLILELKANQTKLVTKLESFKSTDADLVISQRETKE